jgi:hypothetical protein
MSQMVNSVGFRLICRTSGRGGKKSVTLYLPPDKWRELKILAATKDTTMDALMRRGVDLVLAENKAAKPPKS